MNPETFVIGDVKAFTLQPTLDGAAWNMTGGTVTFYLRGSDGVVNSFAATILVPGSMAQYICTTSDLYAAGPWERWWRVQVAGVQETMPAVSFNIQAVP